MQVENIKEAVNVGIKTGNWAQRNPLALAFVVMIFSIGGTWVTLNKRISDKDQENDNCREEVARLNKELKEWQTIVVPGLKQVAPQVAETKEKLDSIINNN